MFVYNEDTHTITVTLPEGCTNQELLVLAEKEMIGFKPTVKYGGVLKITGRCTLPLISFLTHCFANMHQAIAIYDPKLDGYIITVSHSPDYKVGDLI